MFSIQFIRRVVYSVSVNGGLILGADFEDLTFSGEGEIVTGENGSSEYVF